MRGIRTLLLAAILVCIPTFVDAAKIYSEGIQTDPAAQTIMANTGAIVVTGSMLATIQIVITSTVNAKFNLQLRNAADTGNRENFLLANKSLTTSVFTLDKIRVNNDERFRIVMKAGITGNAQASIILR